nr:hypothetical protein [uncultured Flavobacterium sp.]
MINALSSENYKFINKVVILDSKTVFYPLKYVLEKRDIAYDEDLAAVITDLIPEDIKYPGSSKMTDSGMLKGYKIEISTNNQSEKTVNVLESLHNRKVIVLLFHPEGKFIIGCNEMPLEYIYNDDNTSNPASDNGFTITCSGNSYYLKVSV